MDAIDHLKFAIAYFIAAIFKISFS